MTGLIVVILSGILLALYVVRIAGYGIAVFKSPSKEKSILSFDPIHVSVLIPFRNEEKMLAELIRDLQLQSYPADKFEVLFINDHSEDNSAKIFESLSKGIGNIRMLNLDHHKAGKKEAINMGVREAQAEWIIQTDADCRLPENFIYEHAITAEKEQCSFIAGPVLHNKSGNFWQNIEALEFLSLIGTGMGSFLQGRPVMCNGANLSYSKSFYLRNEKELKSIPSPSGDDMFLLIRAKKERVKMKFLTAENTAVTTAHSQSFRDFLQQRIRWGSKARLYVDMEIIYLTFLILLTNGFIAVTLIAAFFEPFYRPVFGAALLLKSIADLILLSATTNKLGRLSLLWYFPLTALFYYFYLLLTGIFSLFLSYSWKDRKTKSKDH